MLFNESELINKIITWLLKTRSLYLYRSYEALCRHRLTVKYKFSTRQAIMSADDQILN